MLAEWLVSSWVVMAVLSSRPSIGLLHPSMVRLEWIHSLDKRIGNWLFSRSFRAIFWLDFTHDRLIFWLSRFTSAS